MADYYSHNDPRRKGNEQYLDYDTGSGAKWIWGGIVLVAIFALLALGSTGGGVPADGAATAADPALQAAPAGTAGE
ncbi:MAG: hypothetical protein LJE62_15970 [Silicimonas sp.]|jgi:hypothetical protein|nr:hypothetical protein [Silicimonas sp.]